MVVDTIISSLEAIIEFDQHAKGNGAEIGYSVTVYGILERTNLMAGYD